MLSFSELAPAGAAFLSGARASLAAAGRTVVVTNRDHRLATRRRVRLSDLAEEVFNRLPGQTEYLFWSDFNPSPAAKEFLNATR